MGAYLALRGSSRRIDRRIKNDVIQRHEKVYVEDDALVEQLLDETTADPGYREPIHVWESVGEDYEAPEEVNPNAGDLGADEVRQKPTRRKKSAPRKSNATKAG